jgi:hypothetical protein
MNISNAPTDATEQPVPVQFELNEYLSAHLKRVRDRLETATAKKQEADRKAKEAAQLVAEANQIQVEVSIGSDTIIQMALEDVGLAGRKYQIMPNLRDVLVH